MNKRLAAFLQRVFLMACLASLWLSTTGYAQHELRVTACDDGQPLPYATVVVRGEPRYTDRDGRITLAPTDSAEVRCVGYATATVTPGQQTVCLEPRAYTLAPVVVGSSPTAKTFGYSPSKRTSFSWIGKADSFVFVLMVKPDAAFRWRLNQATVYLVNHDSLPGSKKAYSPVQLVVYAVDPKTGSPTGPNLIPNLYVQKPKKGNHSLQVDLTQYQLQVPPEGIFCGLSISHSTSGHYDRRTGKPLQMPRISTDKSSTKALNAYSNNPRWGTALRYVVSKRKTSEVYFIRHSSWKENYWITFPSHFTTAFQVSVEPAR